MTQDKDHGLTEEIVLPEHLLPLGSVLGEGVSAMDLCMVLAKIFRVQYTEVALLRLESWPAALYVSRILADLRARFRCPAKQWRRTPR